MEKKITVIKASGEKATFSEDKYRVSLKKSGASQDQIDAIIAEMLPQLHDNISTHELYHKTHELIRTKNMLHVGARYNLRRALFELGPTGFPFERFIARLLDARGFTTHVDQYIPGKCIHHEIDVIAKKGDEHMYVECKFHNNYGERCGIKTTLYVKARYDDIEKPTKQSGYGQCYLVTNTKFSLDSINYANCVGMSLLGWGYPHERGLEKIIDELGLHPITCLSNIPKKFIPDLVGQGTVFCQDIIKNDSQLNQLGLSPSEKESLLQECKAMYG